MNLEPGDHVKYRSSIRPTRRRHQGIVVEIADSWVRVVDPSIGFIVMPPQDILEVEKRRDPPLE